MGFSQKTTHVCRTFLKWTERWISGGSIKACDRVISGGRIRREDARINASVMTLPTGRKRERPTSLRGMRGFNVENTTHEKSTPGGGDESMLWLHPFFTLERQRFQHFKWDKGIRKGGTEINIQQSGNEWNTCCYSMCLSLILGLRNSDWTAYRDCMNQIFKT